MALPPDETMAAIGRMRLVPVVVLDDHRHADGLAEALVTGGLPVAEITFRTAAAEDGIRAMAARGDVLVGAGTVVSADQVDRACNAGASFIVSPGLSRTVVERCRHHDVAVLPGAVTATEVQAALELGLDVLKFFPAGTSGGAKAISALAAPFGGVRFVPTGGVGPENLHTFLNLKTVHAAGGSWMVPRDLVTAGRFDQVRSLVAEAATLVETH